MTTGMLRKTWVKYMIAPVESRYGVNAQLRKLSMAPVQPKEQDVLEQGRMRGKVEGVGSVANLVALLALAISLATFSVTLGTDAETPDIVLALILGLLALTAFATISILLVHGVGVTAARVAALHITEYRRVSGTYDEHVISDATRTEAIRRAS